MLKSFRSSDKKGNSGIEFGAEWYTAIMSQLGEATDVVALLTVGSINRPWILYEAGVAKGKLETTVFGIALGVPLEKVSAGPFGQFQNCGDDEDSLTKLVMQLLRRNPDAEPREEAVRRQVQIFRENEDKILKLKGKKELPSTPTEDQNIAKLFEEVKAMVRELPDRVDDRVKVVSRRGPFRKSRRFHPMMLEKILSFREGKSEPALSWLIFISILRDDIPWIYEAGLELYRVLRTGNIRAIDLAREQFMLMVEMTARNPIFMEFVDPVDEDAFFVMRHLPDIVGRFLSRIPIPEAPARIAASRKSLKIRS